MNLSWQPEVKTKSTIVSQQFLERRDEASFLGIRVDLKTMPELLAIVSEIIETKQKAVVANHNLHSLYLFQREPMLKAFHSRAEWCHIDGMPLVALARLFGYKANRIHRTTYLDWMNALMERAAKKKWRVFYLGSAEGVAERGATFLRRRHPELQIRTAHGYFSFHPGSEENARIIQMIAEFDPQILMVGMGMPRQELWIHQNRDLLPVNVISPCGALMDYIAGVIPTPPRWAGRTGLEWAFRLMHEPRRLWQRYLVEPWSLVGPLLRELVKARLSLGKTSPMND